MTLTWEIGEDEARQILALPAEGRYRSFLMLFADWEEAWGLKDENGWIVRGDHEKEAFPLWPHSTFAAACARGAWEGAVPGMISLEDLLESLLPLLTEDGILVEIFPTPEEAGHVVSSGAFREDLERELELGG
ncbi:MAG TPA: DUF2750 domain-containing protein [Thermoanaerobaculia bacterium]|nr:DUF2750 domain-containing protein [Thermoanaerobaculia bacterium]